MIKNFIERWLNRGDEKSDTQKFWLEFLRDVLNAENPTELIDFEKRVKLAHKSFIDGYIPSTRIIIEQKSFDVNLDKAVKQSDGTFMTPFEQAKRYYDWLPKSEKGNYIVVCNFQEFRIHDMERPKAEPEIIKLENLETQKFLFMIDVNASSPKDIHEVKLSVQAGQLVGRLYDALAERYVNPNNKESLRSLNIFCVRVVFLLYAEDSGLFEKNQFHNYLKARELVARNALRDLFNVLSQKIEERDPYLEADLKNFPYVNGGLFEEKNIELPQLDGEPLRIILEEMSGGFDWSEISPTIFGAVFESTLNPETRHSGGMHYTSIENIHKVIEPLFLNELKNELENFVNLPSATKKQKENKTKKFIEFQDKLSKLKFFDPACGSGNFLTETYLSLRRLENRGLEELMNQQINFASGDFTPIKISLGQFFGIEINDFAVAVARTALWIAESQMMNETKNIIQISDDVLPLKNFNNVIEANALTFDWTTLVKPDKLNFIISNPPFRGARVMDATQKTELNEIFKGWKNAGNLDYVSCWYKKAADFMKENRKIKTALVSTNSICQGDSVATLWKTLFEDGIKINFAWRTFKWDSEATEKAHVHCVIVGFSFDDSPDKKIYDAEKIIEAKNINAYLVDASDVFVESRQHPLCDVPEIGIGNQPIDGGFYLFKEDEMKEFIAKEPNSEKFFHKWYGADEFINRRPRYCLYLGNCPPEELRKMPECLKRVEAVKKFRLKSTRTSTVKLAETPRKFQTENMPTENYIVIPKVSSEKRFYVPIGFMDDSVLCSDRVLLMPDANFYHFGILESSVHMAWMRMTAGRLKSDYNYSKDIVYNNFVWPSVNEKQKAKIVSAAKKILEVREKFPDSSLADLYDPLTMPEELLKAHKANDAAVCEAYGFDKNISEEKIVSALMSLYEKFSARK